MLKCLADAQDHAKTTEPTDAVVVLLGSDDVCYVNYTTDTSTRLVAALERAKFSVLADEFGLVSDL